MSDSEKVGTVQAMYAAFGRGDIPFILDRLRDDVEWTAPTPWNPSSPVTRFDGKNGVRDFFAALNQLEFLTFEPREFTSNGDLVVALGTITAKAISTGTQFSEDWAMAFRFAGDKVAWFREYTDTASSRAAFGAKTAASVN